MPQISDQISEVRFREAQKPARGTPARGGQAVRYPVVSKNVVDPFDSAQGKLSMLPSVRF